MSTKPIMVVAAFALTTALSLPAPAQAGSRSQAYDRPAGAYAQQVKRTHRVHRSRNAYNIRVAIEGPILIRSFATN
jgi:hypothetical protein